MRRALLCLALATSALASAQEAPKADPLNGLEFLLGNWESKEKTKGQDGKEIEFTLKGKNARTLDGRYLEIKEEFEIAGAGKFANLILMTFDPRLGKHRAWWFSNRSRAPIAFTAVKTEKNFVMTSDDDRMRITYDILGDGHYKAVVDIKQADKWEPTTFAEYRRTSK